MSDKTSLAHWFPLIESAGLPVPKTVLLEMPDDAQKCIWAAFDGQDGAQHEHEALDAFCADLRKAGDIVGAPFFLRTAHTSHKHGWKTNCFVADPSKVTQHVFNLCEFSEMCDFMGLPWRTWVVRELLPTIPFGTCPNYGDMPICREFRFFVNGSEIECFHPYWPLHALEMGGAKFRDGFDYDELCRAPDESTLRDIASRAGAAVGGRWSVDILETSGGWFLTDMAEAEKSFHWETCERASR